MLGQLGWSGTGMGCNPLAGRRRRPLRSGASNALSVRNFFWLDVKIVDRCIGGSGGRSLAGGHSQLLGQLGWSGTGVQTLCRGARVTTTCGLCRLGVALGAHTPGLWPVFLPPSLPNPWHLLCLPHAQHQGGAMHSRGGHSATPGKCTACQMKYRPPPSTEYSAVARRKAHGR